jgi:type IV fimbrial biogenesis protein FimT
MLFTPIRWKIAMPRRVCRGFTLIELMVTLTVAAILLGLAAPAFNEVSLSMKLSSHANSMVSSILFARSEAIKRNSVVRVCVSTDGATCGTGGWQQGWIVMCTTSDGTMCDAAGTDTLVLQAHPALATGWKITESSALTSLTFQATGLTSTQSTMTICRQSPSVGSQEREVWVSATGRPSVKKTENGACT